MMRFRRGWTGASTSGPARWPGFVLLVLTVVVPTACLLWFMVEAMRAEQLAVRQRLAEVDRGHLDAVRNRLAARWEERARILLATGKGAAAGERFAAIIRTGQVDSVVVLDEQGVPACPRVAGLSGDGEAGRPASGADDTGWHTAWTDAEALEFRKGDRAAAAEAYGALAAAGQTATGADRVALAARAWHARARCLTGLGDIRAALQILTVELAAPRFHGAIDGTGRPILPDALFRALELLAESDDRAAFGRTARMLVARLNDHGEPVLPASQRLFLMTALLDLLARHSAWLPEDLRKGMANRELFPWRPAEKLAADYLATHASRFHVASLSALWLSGPWQSGTLDRDRPVLTATGLGDVHQIVWTEAGLVALFRDARFSSELAEVHEELALPDDVTLSLGPPGAAGEERGYTASRPAGWPHIGWQLVLDRTGAPFPDAIERSRNATYLWTGLLFIAAFVALVALLARFLRRQMHTARIKNDLVATVSHELKTPLASIRLLVDTLLAGHDPDPVRTREYLELIARENDRLGQLIENFLTFSRMERNKKVFDLAHVGVEEIVDEALVALGETIRSEGFRVDREVDPGLPPVRADRAALVRVLVNLLDNALKYSREDRWVAIRAYAAEGQVMIQVQDHGVGLTARDTRKIFDRFYQVDRRLSRRAGGCGLGLCIVKFVIDAHGGTIQVASQPGEGSSFTVCLPWAVPEPVEHDVEPGRGTTVAAESEGPEPGPGTRE